MHLFVYTIYVFDLYYIYKSQNPEKFQNSVY